MVRIAIVIPYASMANLAWDVFQEHTEQMRLQALDARSTHWTSWWRPRPRSCCPSGRTATP